MEEEEEDEDDETDVGRHDTFFAALAVALHVWSSWRNWSNFICQCHGVACPTTEWQAFPYPATEWHALPRSGMPCQGMASLPIPCHGVTCPATEWHALPRNGKPSQAMEAQEASLSTMPGRFVRGRHFVEIPHNPSCLNPAPNTFLLAVRLVLQFCCVYQELFGSPHQMIWPGIAILLMPKQDQSSQKPGIGAPSKTISASSSLRSSTISRAS